MKMAMATGQFHRNVFWDHLKWCRSIKLCLIQYGPMHAICWLPVMGVPPKNHES